MTAAFFVFFLLDSIMNLIHKFDNQTTAHSSRKVGSISSGRKGGHFAQQNALTAVPVTPEKEPYEDFDRPTT